MKDTCLSKSGCNNDYSPSKNIWTKFIDSITRFQIEFTAVFRNLYTIFQERVHS